MTEYTYDENTVSDLHKDAYGMRPSQGWWFIWNGFTAEEKQAEWERLIDIMEYVSKLEKERQQESVVKFEVLVAKTVDSGAKDRVTALRWIMEASDCNGDWEYLCWTHGLPYQYFKV